MILLTEMNKKNEKHIVAVLFLTSSYEGSCRNVPSQADMFGTWLYLIDGRLHGIQDA